ncbi:multi-copy leucine-rich repeat protein, putative [Bodo saltans]|uniref:Multi-copy leucine-rich repeat protein, putative n=1 Tax=Bodo saltans TaxID=75058 RepID=A0A0S4JCG0_BODSA|nr:multi-copy leucine-rich repeat protein, putative [Bodo saltans]|eukprot:CUG87705.1 multi-copy leucine-rich repeat protein, putative [Bodo saltans]
MPVVRAPASAINSLVYEYLAEVHPDVANVFVANAAVEGCSSERAREAFGSKSLNDVLASVMKVPGDKDDSSDNGGSDAPPKKKRMVENVVAKKPVVVDMSPASSEPVSANNAQESLEKAVTDWLMEPQHQLKDGNVFAATVMDQKQLNDIQSYLDKPKMARPVFGGVPLKLSGSVEREVHRHVHKRETSGLGAANRTSLLCNSGNSGTGKTTLLQLTTLASVRELKTMVGQHMKAKGIEEAEEDVEEVCTEWRPLGFYVTFNNVDTPIDADCNVYGGNPDAPKFPILTAIALRMVYSVVKPPKTDSFVEFAVKIAAHCKQSDHKNFDCIIGSLRRVLQWKGPMFIAIDEFKMPFENRPPQERIDGLESVCRYLLDQASKLFTNAPAVYTSYIAVSVYDAVDTVRLSMGSKRQLIAQAMPHLSVRDVALLASVGDGAIAKPYLAKSYLDILGQRRKHIGPLRPHQLLFLLHMALSSGTSRIMSDCLMLHGTDIFGKDGHPTKWHSPSRTTLNTMFWNGSNVQTPRGGNVTNRQCIYAAQLVAGYAEVDIFDNGISGDYRVFALDPELALSCTVTDVASTLRAKAGCNRSADESATRVLVSPAFLRSVLQCWDVSWSSSIRAHVSALEKSLTYRTRLATALVRVGATLVAHGGRKPEDASHLSSVCDKLIARWMDTATVGFEHLTFDALCLHLSCALADEQKGEKAKSLHAILSRVCSNVAVSINVEVQVGALERVDIPNFPSWFFDVYATVDAELNNNDLENKAFEDSLKACEYTLDTATYAELNVAVDCLTEQHRQSTKPSGGDTSYTRLQTALAKEHHFCFQPSNPNNQAEDGVVFLRNIGDALTWTVLLPQNKFWLRDTHFRGKKRSQNKSVVEEWSNTMGHLPATVLDKNKKAHRLQYVRILVTANPVDTDPFEEEQPPQKYAERMTKLDKRIDVLGRANAAFVKLNANEFAAVSRLATEWVHNVLEDQIQRGASADQIEDHLMAGLRAEELLRHRPMWQPVERGHMLGECRMDLDTMTRWCPTVGLFASNIIAIRDLTRGGSARDLAGHSAIGEFDEADSVRKD